jgi:hypothetical protein
VLVIYSAALAVIRPAVTGCSPDCSALRQAASLKRNHAELPGRGLRQGKQRAGSV